MSTYCLYNYDCGSLKLFGRRTTRAHHATIEDAVKEYTTHVEFMKRVNNGKNILHKAQVLIVEYTGTYESEIVGIIQNGHCTLFKK